MVFATYQILLGWEIYNIIKKPSNSPTQPNANPTQGQPNPRKNRLIVAFGPPFSHSKQFFVG